MSYVKLTIDEKSCTQLQREYRHFCRLLGHIAPEYKPRGFASYVKSRISGVNLLREDVIKSALESGPYQDVKRQVGGRFDQFILAFIRRARECGLGLCHPDGESNVSVDHSCKALARLLACDLRLPPDSQALLEIGIREVIQSPSIAFGSGREDQHYQAQHALLAMLLDLQTADSHLVSLCRQRFIGFIDALMTINLFSREEAASWLLRMEEWSSPRSNGGRNFPSASAASGHEQ